MHVLVQPVQHAYQPENKALGGTSTARYRLGILPASCEMSEDLKKDGNLPNMSGWGRVCSIDLPAFIFWSCNMPSSCPNGRHKFVGINPAISTASTNIPQLDTDPTSTTAIFYVPYWYWSTIGRSSRGTSSSSFQSSNRPLEKSSQILQMLQVVKRERVSATSLNASEGNMCAKRYKLALNVFWIRMHKLCQARIWSIYGLVGFPKSTSVLGAKKKNLTQTQKEWRQFSCYHLFVTRYVVALIS